MIDSDKRNQIKENLRRISEVLSKNIVKPAVIEQTIAEEMPTKKIIKSKKKDKK